VGSDDYRRESGVRRLVFCWCVWQESGFSRREDVFILNLLHKEILVCTFNAICKVNAATNRIYVQHKKLISVNFDVSYYASQEIKAAVAR
jgi:hypothetical protein